MRAPRPERSERSEPLGSGRNSTERTAFWVAWVVLIGAWIYAAMRWVQ
jgi:hypothetical protein